MDDPASPATRWHAGRATIRNGRIVVRAGRADPPAGRFDGAAATYSIRAVDGVNRGKEYVFD